jgi:hypothetical protein
LEVLTFSFFEEKKRMIFIGSPERTNTKQFRKFFRFHFLNGENDFYWKCLENEYKTVLEVFSFSFFEWGE